VKNFLSIVWYRVLPPVYGGQKGIAIFNEYLGRKVSLTCICSRNNTAEEHLSYEVLNELPASKLQFQDPSVRKRILSIIKERSFSHVIIEHPYHAWLGNYKEKLQFRFIVHAHNIEHLRMKSRGKLWWPLIKTTEKKAFSLADRILFKTEKDRDSAIKLFKIPPGKCLIVPYGITLGEQPVANPTAVAHLKKKYGVQKDDKIILFAGSPGYEPNERALDTILNHIHPLLQKNKFRFRLFICGALREKKNRQLSAVTNVIVTGFVPDLTPFLQAADVFINPVTTGSGIQTKNIEAIAQGCNVVSTEFAAAGLPGYLVNKKLFISPNDDWNGFAENIIKAGSIKTAVPKQFYKDYNWENIIERATEAFQVLDSKF
jgi:glycosyltransferase involved in cell wall biosynthesis